MRTLLIPPDDKAQFTNLLAELSGRPECSIDQLETEALMNVRESFRQTASNLAKVHKTYWPMLVPLICDKSSKSRKRSGSGISED